MLSEISSDPCSLVVWSNHPAIRRPGWIPGGGKGFSDFPGSYSTFYLNHLILAITNMQFWIFFYIFLCSELNFSHQIIFVDCPFHLFAYYFAGICTKCQNQLYILKNEPEKGSISVEKEQWEQVSSVEEEQPESASCRLYDSGKTGLAVIVSNQICRHDTISHNNFNPL